MQPFGVHYRERMNCPCASPFQGAIAARQAEARQAEASYWRLARRTGREESMAYLAPLRQAIKSTIVKELRRNVTPNGCSIESSHSMSYEKPFVKRAFQKALEGHSLYDRQDFILVYAGGGLHFHGFADFVAEQGFAEGRCVRDAVLGRIGFHDADDLIL